MCSGGLGHPNRKAPCEVGYIVCGELWLCTDSSGVGASCPDICRGIGGHVLYDWVGQRSSPTIYESLSLICIKREGFSLVKRN